MILSPIFSLFFLSLVFFRIVEAIDAQQIDWDCSKSQQACENYCFTTICLPSPLDNDWENGPAGKTSKIHRQESGVKDNRPCTNLMPQKQTYWCKKYGQCPPSELEGINADEWPAARTLQGGVNAWLRCMDGADNRGEKMNPFVSIPRHYQVYSVMVTDH